jgi:hypothetical protein
VLKVSHIGLVCVICHECVGKCAQLSKCRVVVSDECQENAAIKAVSMRKKIDQIRIYKVGGSPSHVALLKQSR